MIGALNLDEDTCGKEAQDLLNLLCPTATFVLTGFCKAKHLVEGLITDSIAAKEDNELSTGIGDNLNESRGNLEVGDEHNTTGCDDTTDISFSLATETEDPTIE